MSVLEKFIDYIGFDKIFSFLQELILFYTKPAKFFRIFFSNSLKHRITQTTFYALLLIGIGYLLIDESTIRYLLKALISELSLLIFTFIILFLSDYITSKIQKQANNAEKIIFYIILVKLLIGPFQLVFFGLFTSYENYNLYFLANVVVLVHFIYIFIISAIIINHKIKYIILSILLNMVISNIFMFADSFITIDDFSTFESPYYTDPILKERFKTDELVPFADYKIPSHIVIYNSNDKNEFYYFLFTTPSDSVCRGSFETSVAYRKNIKLNLAKLDTIIPNLKYKRNKDHFDILFALDKSIDSLMSKRTISYSKRDICKHDIYYQKNPYKKYVRSYVFVTDRISQLNTKLINDQYETLKASVNSKTPLDMIMYFYPISFIIDKD